MNLSARYKKCGSTVRPTMMHLPRVRTVFILLLVGAVIGTGGCSVYFNLFFNAKKAFNKAESARKTAQRSGAGAKEYQEAIDKCQKIVEVHPNSKYYDDAVYILGVSFYHTGEYARAERRFRELLADYPDSKYTREAQLYLAKAKLQLGDIDDARAQFEEIFRSDYDREFKTDAARALGEYHMEKREFADAREYWRALRDSLGEKTDQLTAQINIADCFFEDFRFKDALGAYLQVVGMEPDTKQKYHAYYRAAQCAFALQRIDDGLAYLQDLADDELYFDSLGALKLAMARGYEADDDLVQAQVTYEDITTTVENPVWLATANYRLGLIYQVDYGQLDKAKEYYDKVSEGTGGSPVRPAAVQRAADIGKLQNFTHAQLDTAATQAAIDDAAYSQFQLAELLWFQLNEPDSALREMWYLVDSMPPSYYSPKGLITLAGMIRERRGETEAADSLLKEVLIKYPHSDYVPQALEQLGLIGTAADTGYAELHIRRAEDFLVDEKNVDSARAQYQYVVDNFHESSHYIPARFALLWLTEEHAAPGDSSLILAYQEFADSFPSDPLAREALDRIGGERTPTLAQAGADREGKEAGEEGQVQDTFAASGGAAADTSRYIDPKVALYYGPGGDTLVDLRLDPIEILEPFVFPDEAATVDVYEWKLYFQVLIDFSGRVKDYVLKIPSGVEEIDRRAALAVESRTFDGVSVSNRAVSAGLPDQPGAEGRWFVYEYLVKKPEYLR